jgi:hypothetical protein
MDIDSKFIKQSVRSLLAPLHNSSLPRNNRFDESN